jgi:hypothetical protein
LKRRDAHLARRATADEVYVARQRQRVHSVSIKCGTLRHTRLARCALRIRACFGHCAVQKHVAVAVVHRGVRVVELECVCGRLPVLDRPLGGGGARLVHAFGQPAAACATRRMVTCQTEIDTRVDIVCS